MPGVFVFHSKFPSVELEGLWDAFEKIFGFPDRAGRIIFGGFLRTCPGTFILRRFASACIYALFGRNIQSGIQR